MKGTVAVGGSLSCTNTGGTGGAGGGGAGGAGGGLLLSSTRTSPAGMLMLTLIKAPGGAVTQQVMRTDATAQTRPATVSHMIIAPAKAGALQASADLSSASARGAAPFLTGTLQFAGQGSGSFASGTLSGSLTARFDSIGAQRLAQGDATLTRR
jgi:hypothetical protein